MKNKNFACIVVNCVIYFIFANSELSTILLKKIHYDFILDIMPIITISAIFSFIGEKNIKERLIDFAKTFIVSCLCIIVIVFFCVLYAMSKFN